MYKHLCNDNAARSMQRYGSSYTKIQLITHAKVAYFLKKVCFFNDKEISYILFCLTLMPFA